MAATNKGNSLVLPGNNTMMFEWDKLVEEIDTISSANKEKVNW